MLRSPAMLMRIRMKRFSEATQTRFHCRFGSQRRRDLLFACERLLPLIGRLPVTRHTLAMTVPYSRGKPYRPLYSILEDLSAFCGLFSPAEAAYRHHQTGSNAEAGDLQEDAGEALFAFELRQEVDRRDVEEATGRDGQEPGDGGNRVGSGEEDSGYPEERREACVEGEAKRAGERYLEMDKEGEVAHAVRNLMQGDGEGSEPADARRGQEGDGDGGSIHKAVEHAGEDEGSGARALGGVLVVVLGTGFADLRLGAGAGDDEEETLGGEERDHGGAGEEPGEGVVSELLDGLREKVQERGREEDADGEGDDIGELAAERLLASTQKPGRGGSGKLHGGGGEDGGDDPDGGDNCSLKVP